MSIYSRYVRHNLGLKLLSLAAAALLWAAVAREPIAEVAVNVPIEFQNIADPLEISSETLPEAQVRVRGPARLVRDVNRAGVHCVVDLTGFTPGERTVELGPARVQAPGELQVTQVIPTRLTIELDRRVTRAVSVRPRVTGQFASGLHISEVASDPPEVTIVGPEQRVRAVESATTDPVDATGVVGRQSFASHVYVTDPLVRVTSAAAVRVTVTTGKSGNGSSR